MKKLLLLIATLAFAGCAATDYNPPRAPSDDAEVKTGTRLPRSAK